MRDVGHAAEPLALLSRVRVRGDAVALRVGEELHLNDMKLLLYYQNRLTGYGLEALFAPSPSQRVTASS